MEIDKPTSGGAFFLGSCEVVLSGRLSASHLNALWGGSGFAKIVWTSKLGMMRQTFFVQKTPPCSAHRLADRVAAPSRSSQLAMVGRTLLPLCLSPLGVE
jgi:hypothetical protein